MHLDDELLRLALAEDIGAGDVTTEAIVPESARCLATVLAKCDGIVSGIGPFRRVFELLDAGIGDWESVPDGERFLHGDPVARFSARTAAILTGERVALNLLQRLCGTATLTAQYVAAVEGTGASICDTRKTTPLWRRLEKRAVRDGGGLNHRFALYDGVLIKENHIQAAGGIEAAIDAVNRHKHHLLKVQVEVSTLDQFAQAMDAGADAVLLDNMSLEQMKAAVERGGDTGVLLEASGNMTLERVPGVAACGVDLISVGALTHSAPASDLSLRLEG